MFKSSYNLLKVSTSYTLFILLLYTQVAVEIVTTVKPEKLVDDDEEIDGMEIFQKGSTNCMYCISLILNSCSSSLLTHSSC